MTSRRPWRTKSAQNKGNLRIVQAPGECVSVDQLESQLPGFVAQLKGKLTRKRYKAATAVFVDHKSRLSYVHLQESLTSKETVEAKHAFKALARSFGIRILHYHGADNGHFADNLFLKDVATSGQTISFCGVSAHFQNGIAEKMIRDLQELTRKQLTRIIKKPERLIEVAYLSYYEVLHEDDYKLQDNNMLDPISFLSHHSDPDTMYFHEAIRQPDRE
jgi:hypothetical protein